MHFYELPKFVSQFTHSIQLKDTSIEVSNAHLNTQPITWIERNSTNLLSLMHK